MKKIKLTQGKYALVDDDDFGRLNQWNWYYASGYAVRNISVGIKKQKQIRMHQEILFVSTGKEIDHRDGNGLNNQRSNLRSCFHIENTRNKCIHKDSMSGYKGVSWYAGARKWKAQIMVSGEKFYLGLFSNVMDAAYAYDVAAKKYHGDFARCNFE